MINTLSAGGLVKNRQGLFVIVNQGKGTTLPKGHVEKGEDLETTARREIFEETGLNDLRLIRFLGSYNRLSGSDPNEMKTMNIFLFETDKTKLEPHEDFITAKWVDFEELNNLLTYVEDKDFINNLDGKEL